VPAVAGGMCLARRITELVPGHHWVAGASPRGTFVSEGNIADARRAEFLVPLTDSLTRTSASEVILRAPGRGVVGRAAGNDQWVYAAFASTSGLGAMSAAMRSLGQAASSVDRLPAAKISPGEARLLAPIEAALEASDELRAGYLIDRDGTIAQRGPLGDRVVAAVAAELTMFLDVDLGPAIPIDDHELSQPTNSITARLGVCWLCGTRARSGHAVWLGGWRACPRACPASRCWRAATALASDDADDQRSGPKPTRWRMPSSSVRRRVAWYWRARGARKKEKCRVSAAPAAAWRLSADASAPGRMTQAPAKSSSSSSRRNTPGRKPRYGTPASITSG